MNSLYVWIGLALWAGMCLFVAFGVRPRPIENLRTVLPRPSVWDTIQLTGYPEPKITRLGRIGRFRCAHREERRVTYSRVDHRSGYGYAADVYRGTVCADCGRTFKEHKVY